MHWFCAAKWVLSPAMIKGTRNGIELEITPKGDGNCSHVLTTFAASTCIELEITPKGDGN